MNSLRDKRCAGQCRPHTRSKIGIPDHLSQVLGRLSENRVEFSLTWRSANDTATASNESLRWSEPSGMSREQGRDQGAYEKPNEKHQCQHPNRCGGFVVQRVVASEFRTHCIFPRGGTIDGRVSGLASQTCGMRRRWHMIGSWEVQVARR